MKRLNFLRLVVFSLGVMCVLSGGVCQANTVDVGMQVTMAAATSVQVTITEIKAVEGSDDIWGSSQSYTSGSALINFDNHSLVESGGILTTGYYYAIDIGPVGGGWVAEAPVYLTYTSGSPDIADHATATVVRAVYQADDEDPEVKDMRSLSTVPYSKFSSGWLRLYIGLATGSDDEQSLTNVSPITSATPAGTYTGTLRITYTGN